MNMNFTVPEMNIICMFKGETKAQTIENIMSTLPHINEAEGKIESESAIEKLDKITEAEFAATVFEPEYGD